MSGGKQMQTKNISALVVGLILAAAPWLFAQSWSLPHGTAVKDSGPRTYRFSVEYSTSDTKGQITRRQRLTGDYTRGLPGGDVIWKNVSETDANGSAADFGPAEKRDFMEGFRYQGGVPGFLKTMAPDFFKGFPPTAVFERNLVWDTGMIELFGQNYFDDLKLNQPLHDVSSQTIKMPDVGTFQNRDIQLLWTGGSQRNGRDCAVIEYSAYFNPLEIANGGINLRGRSHYWGLIWVALTTKQIEYATLHEDVMGELKLPGQDATQVIDVFRSAVFEPVTGN
jgi:hypothetical protein